MSATPLNSRIYVTCSYAFVFCRVFKVFFLFLYNSFSSSSSTAAGIPGDFDVIQPRPPKPPIRLSVSDVLGRRAGLPSPGWLRRPDHLRVSGPEVGDDIWAVRASLSSSSDQIPNLTLPTQMGSTVDKTCNFIW